MHRVGIMAESNCPQAGHITKYQASLHHESPANTSGFEIMGGSEF